MLDPDGSDPENLPVLQVICGKLYHESHGALGSIAIARIDRAQHGGQFHSALSIHGASRDISTMASALFNQSGEMRKVLRPRRYYGRYPWMKKIAEENHRYAAGEDLNMTVYFVQELTLTTEV